MRARVMRSFVFRVDASALDVAIDELLEIFSRRGLVPEFLEYFVDIRNILPHGVEVFQADDASASTGEIPLVLNVAQPLLDRLAALRAFDRDFDLIGQAHGRSFRDEV